MLDIKTLRQDPDSVTQALEKRGIEFDLPRLVRWTRAAKRLMSAPRVCWQSAKPRQKRLANWCLRSQRRGSKGPSRRGSWLG
jgi:seryl-tRNA synthetase